MAGHPSVAGRGEFLLEPRDRSRLKDIRARLHTVVPSETDSSSAPAWLPSELEDLLGGERFMSYRPTRAEDGAWTLGERVSTDEAFFLKYGSLAGGLPSPFRYNPLKPEPSQRNRARRLHETRMIASDASSALDDIWSQCGIRGHDQLRALICEGPVLLAWIGGLRDSPFTQRECSLLAALVRPLRRALSLHRTLVDAGIARAGLACALDATGAPSFVARRDGRVVHASASGAMLLDRLGGAVRERLRDIIAGSTDASFVARIDAPGAAERFLVVLRDLDSTLHARLAEAQRLWGITRRELAVLRWVVVGDSNKEIALKLSIHEGSAERHLTSLLRKARCDARSRLVAAFWTTL